MNPKLLVCYACERTVLPSGARMFKHFATSVESQQLFVYAFWFVHCKFFQVTVLFPTPQFHNIETIIGSTVPYSTIANSQRRYNITQLYALLQSLGSESRSDEVQL